MEERKTAHWKKIIAPTVITVLLICYFLFFLVILISIPELGLGIKLLSGLVPLGFLIVVIYILIERIREIRGGEEDDLSKY